MPSLIENVRSSTRRKALKCWLIHMTMRFFAIRGELKDLPRPQESRACRIQLTARFDPERLFLFGYIKDKLLDYNCKSREDLLNATTEIFTDSIKKRCSLSSNSG
jgi:hypothetical protein